MPCPLIKKKPDREDGLAPVFIIFRKTSGLIRLAYIKAHPCHALLSEHIRYVHAAAKAPVLTAVTVDSHQPYNTATPMDLAI